MTWEVPDLNTPGRTPWHKSETLESRHRITGWTRQQVVRNAVIVRVEDDVIVNVDPCARPLAEIKALGGQRIQCRLVESDEMRRTRAFSFAERPLVDTLAQLADGLRAGLII